ncbi:hypothetical protein [Aquamicrobium sp. LC103]|uniref:hypothetical protein n=1 Tax=Aquamicrobium sp. LC103 TaxID=1120658 RepID=UPI00063EB5B5|nr:hypothetical protein [Aquamicrobium sp. LC103]TKT81318.1 hypothetical protein XW59_005495 [Aquamicrobium sp. LC103]
MDRGITDIDTLIREEKRLTAVESYEEAWAEGLSAGIEPEIMAEAAIATAIAELRRTSGEESILALLERMGERVVSGEFDPDRRFH